MTKDQIKTYLATAWEGEEFLLADGFEDAFLGVVYGKMRNPVACYDRQRCIEILMAQGMEEDEAEEFFGFNVDDAWVGEKTPVFCVQPHTGG